MLALKGRMAEADWRGVIGFTALVGYIILLALGKASSELSVMIGLIVGWYFGTKTEVLGEVWRRKRMVDTPPIGGVGGLKTLIGDLKAYTAETGVFPLKKTPEISRVREDLVDRLTFAINDAYHQAKGAVGGVEKGVGTSMREKYWRLMGYLCQVLDGILSSITRDELLKRVERLEAALGELGEADKPAGSRSKAAAG